MTAIAARRRHPMATVVIMLIALVVVGGAYSALAPSRAEASTTSAEDVTAGRDLFLANCSNCHGLQAEGTQNGPTLIGVGAASVDFQVGTGRMPLQANSVQAPQRTVDYSEEEISQMAAYVASLAPGPAIPAEEYTSTVDDPERISKGNELFRTNCAMCHNVVGAGGALTRGKWAPEVQDTTGKHIYEALLTGPSNMPVFNDANISPEEKQDIISYLHNVNENESPGGVELGSIGPVTEGAFAWIAGITLLIASAVWLTSRSS